MASDKPFYKLTIKLDSARADALAEAIQQLRDIASDYDTAAQSSATLIFESYQEAPIIGIREQFELWLHRHQIGLGCEQIPVQVPRVDEIWRDCRLASLVCAHLTTCNSDVAHRGT